MSTLKPQTTTENKVVISVEDLYLSFYTDHGRVQAVRGISFELHRGEILCIVGESGSGKSVTAKTIMGILPGNGRIDGGAIMYEGEDLTQVSEAEFHRIRGKRIGMVFQDPLSSLNPIMKVGKQITEAIVLNGDKMKKYYRDLIDKEFIAYKNAESKKVRIKELAQLDYNEAKRNRDRTIEKAKLDSSLTSEQRKVIIADAKEAFKPERKIKKEKYKSANVEMNPIIKETKKQLNVVKKSAKVQVKAKKNELKKIRTDRISEEKKKFKDSDLAGKQQILANIKQIKEDYTNEIKVTKKAARERAISVMKEVGIPNAERRFTQYPFEFSGEIGRASCRERV